MSLLLLPLSAAGAAATAAKCAGPATATHFTNALIQRIGKFTNFLIIDRVEEIGDIAESGRVITAPAAAAAAATTATAATKAATTTAAA